MSPDESLARPSTFFPFVAVVPIFYLALRYVDLTLSRLARPRKEENALSRYNFGHTRKTWGREGKGRETEWFRARGSSFGKETIESLSFFSRLSLFFPFLSPREIYIRDVRGFDKLRDCRRRFKDIRAKVFTSFSAGFQILFFCYAF